MTEPNDLDRVEALVRAAAAGDATAFGALLELHRPAIGSTLAACGVRSRDTAFDLTQDVALRAWHKLPELRDPRAFPGWLRRVAANAARDHLRRRLARRETALEEAADGLVAPEDPRTLAERGEELRLMREALGEEGDEVVEMLTAQAEGTTIVELSERAGLSEGAVKMRLSRARDRLRRRLERLRGSGAGGDE